MVERSGNGASGWHAGRLRKTTVLFCRKEYEKSLRQGKADGYQTRILLSVLVDSVEQIAGLLMNTDLPYLALVLVR